MVFVLMLIVVTGGIGSGKTYVTKIFETLNIPILYADQIAKDIILTNKNIYDTIQKYFNVFNVQQNFKKIKLEIGRASCRERVCLYV